MDAAPLLASRPPWVDRHRRGYERGIAHMLGWSTAILAAGFLVAVWGTGLAVTAGAWTQLVGLVGLGIALGMAQPVQSLRTIGTIADTRYERGRHWTQLKAASLLLDLLVLCSAALLIAAALDRVGTIDLVLGQQQEARVVALYAAIVSIVAGYTFFLSLRTPVERAITGLRPAFAILAGGTAVAFAGVSAAVAMRGATTTALGLFETVDAPFLGLAAVGALGIAVHVARAPPPFSALFSAERDYSSGRAFLSRRKSVLLPTAMAFALLFTVVLVVIVFQIGIAGLVEEVPRSVTLLGFLGLIVAAMLAALVTSVLVSRSEEHVAVYRTHRTPEQKREVTLLATSTAVTVFFFGVAVALAMGWHGPIALLTPDRWIDFVCFGLLAAVGPFGFYQAGQARRIRRLEERFPDFLRDLAANRRAGLTLEASVRVAARGEYGELTPEIHKMADQLSWNVPFERALGEFGERVRTPLVRRAVTVIQEAGRTGGHVTDVLQAAAGDAREIKNLENERHSTMTLYTMIIYITFFVFLFVAAVLYASFIPKMVAAQEATKGVSATGLAGFSLGGLDQGAFRSFYFMASLMQALGNGLMAGVLGSGRARAGLPHAFAMVGISYVTFAFLL